MMWPSCTERDPGKDCTAWARAASSHGSVSGGLQPRWPVWRNNTRSQKWFAHPHWRHDCICQVYEMTSVCCTHNRFSWSMSNEAAMLISVGKQCKWWLWEWGRIVLAWKREWDMFVKWCGLTMLLRLKQFITVMSSQTTFSACICEHCRSIVVDANTQMINSSTMCRSSPRSIVALTDICPSLPVTTSTRPCTQTQNECERYQNHHVPKFKNEKQVMNLYLPPVVHCWWRLTAVKPDSYPSDLV